MSKAADLIHAVAGGAGGTAGAIFTCPLEVVKTRLQSSNSGFPTDPKAVEALQAKRASKLRIPPKGQATGAGSAVHKATQAVNYLSPPEIAAERRIGPIQTTIPVRPHRCSSGASRVVFNPSFTDLVVVRRYASTLAPRPERHMNVIQCLKFIYHTEGVLGLFKGLGPNLMGVAPSRAVYFWAYSTAKKNVNESLPKQHRDSPFVHVTSAVAAGFSASTTTNPIWLIKTRLQLDRASGAKTLSIRKCIQQIYTERGVFGFWRGVTASYWGISETMIHFVVYESLKKRLATYQNKHKDDKKTLFDFVGWMMCGSCSKFCATCIAYPHEVARTRLREQGKRYKTFWQTLGVVYREEGRKGLYRGLGTQLMRQIPNTAIMMSTYEITVHVLNNWATSAPTSSTTSTLTSDLSDASKDAQTSR